MNESAISVRYAKALYDLAIEQDKKEIIFENISLIKEILSKESELKTFLKSPAISGSEKKTVLKKIFTESADSLTIRFLELLTEKKREIFLYRIALEYIRLYTESKNLVHVKITSATKLNPKQIKEFETTISTQLKKEPLIEITEDSSIIGGYQLIIGDKQIDHSVKGMLKEFIK